MGPQGGQGSGCPWVSASGVSSPHSLPGEVLLRAALCHSLISGSCRKAPVWLGQLWAEGQGPGLQPWVGQGLDT